MTHVSLFTGIGGIDLAAEWAGFRTVAQVERDPYCLRVLERHWPGVHRCTDVREFPDRDYGAVTLVSGGFPCQPFSAAGKRRGREDDRHLWPEMLRVIHELAPRVVLAENVLGLLSIESGMVFETVLADLEAEGYETWAGVVPAAGVGAPHLRYRVFVVGHAASRRAAAIQQSGQSSGTKQTSPHVAYAEPGGRGRWTGEQRQRRRAELADGGDVADTDKQHDHGTGRGASAVCGQWREETEVRRPSTDAASQGLEELDGSGSRESCAAAIFGDWWATEPDVGRVAHGVPHRVDRLRALGNAVVPQQVYPILRAIAEVAA